MPEMRISASPKEVAELQVALATLPFPPLPVRVQITNNISVEQDKDGHNAFAMATLELTNDAKKGDGIINSHNAIAALLLFWRWGGKASSYYVDSMDRQKSATVLALMHGALQLMTRECIVPDDDKGIYALYFGITQRYLDAMMPQEARILLSPVDEYAALGHEHILHIAMAHYCYCQGEMYSRRKGLDKCLVHQAVREQYKAKCARAREDPDGPEARSVDKETVREKGMEMAEIYSQNTLCKLLALCFVRLKNDTLYGCKGMSGFDTAVAGLRGSVDKLNSSMLCTEQKLELAFDDLLA